MFSTNKYSPLICVILIIPLAMLVLLLPAVQSQASDAEPPSQLPAPVWFEDCDFFGPPNITANPPKGDNYYVRLKSFDMTSDGRPLSFQLTYNTDKLLPPGGRAVIQFWPSQKKITSNEDLCGYVSGGCPIHPGDFTVNFNLTIDSFTEIQFSIFTKAGELLHCVYFEES